jgi:uncharacterized protein (TIRG00374 family)
MALPRKMGRRLLAGVLFGVVMYAGMAIWVDARGVGESLRRLPLWTLPAACGLSLANYVVRYWKWSRYLHLLGIRIDRRASWLIYFSGFSMSVTPGKLGEVFKSFLLKQLDGTPIHKSAPIVVAERFTDLLAYLLLLAVTGVAVHPEYQWIFALTLGLCVAAFLLAGSERFSKFTSGLFKKLPWVWRLAPRIEGSFASTRVLLAPRELVLPTLTSVVGWGLECAGFWLIARHVVDGDVPFQTAVFAYAFSAVAGAVLIIFPGGLGVTEGSMGSMLRRHYTENLGLAKELARQPATAAVILTRLCTLWFAVLLGIAATALFTRRYGRVEEDL